MNCKEGDLAVIVRSRAGNEGVFVTCIRIATAEEIEEAYYSSNRVVWVIDRSVKTYLGFWRALAYDDGLRPIRDQPGADETLSWKDVPQEVAA